MSCGLHFMCNHLGAMCQPMPLVLSPLYCHWDDLCGSAMGHCSRAASHDSKRHALQSAVCIGARQSEQAPDWLLGCPGAGSTGSRCCWWGRQARARPACASVWRSSAASASTSSTATSTQRLPTCWAATALSGAPIFAGHSCMLAPFRPTTTSQQLVDCCKAVPASRQAAAHSAYALHQCRSISDARLRVLSRPSCIQERTGRGRRHCCGAGYRTGPVQQRWH